MNRNRSSKSREEPRIIIRCEKCKKRLRIPPRGGKLPDQGVVSG